MTTCQCGGTGLYYYPNTGTWHCRPGGVSGQAFTWDVCDGCWGTGDPNAPGPNLREQAAAARAEWQRRYREDAAFRWKERARRFARRAWNHRENYRSLLKYEVEPLRRRVAELQEILRLKEEGE